MLEYILQYWTQPFKENFCLLEEGKAEQQTIGKSRKQDW